MSVVRLLVLLWALAVGGCASLAPPPPPPGATEEPEEPAKRAAPIEKPSLPLPATEVPAPSAPERIDDGRALFDRLAARFSAPVCVRGVRNLAWRRRYSAHPAGFERQLRDALPLIAYVVEEIERRDLPGEFALIPIVESGYRPDARGPGGPAGLWQMIGSTARNHGVRVAAGYDGRLSPVDSTQAALDYLAVLHREFGDWRATAMAYNAGEGRLRRAFDRHGETRVSGERLLPPGLSTITYAYVAKLHALACLVKEPSRHGLTLPEDRFVPLEARQWPPGVDDLEAAARQWGLDAMQLARWNPAYRGKPADRAAPRQLLVPRDAKAPEALTAPEEPNIPTSASGIPAPARSHVVRSGDTLWRIARRYGTSVRAVAAANGLDVDRPLRIGRRLAIPD